VLQCNVFNTISEVCENPTRGRSWFFTSVGLEVFHVRIPCSLFLFLFFNFFWTCYKQPARTRPKAYSSENCENLKTQFTPLLCFVSLFLTSNFVLKPCYTPLAKHIFLSLSQIYEASLHVCRGVVSGDHCCDFGRIDFLRRS